MNDPFEILHDELVRVAMSRPPRLALRLHRAARPRRHDRSRVWLRRPLIVAIVLVGASASAGGLALAGTFDGGTINPQAWVDGQRVQPEAAMTPDQTTSLAILRRPRLASDALPAYYAQVLTNTPAGGSEGVNVSLSRRAYGFSDGAAAWVIPANAGTICLVAANPQALQEISEPATEHVHVPGADDDVQCEADSTVTNGWPLAYGNDGTTPGMNFTAGIAPDGVAQVTVGVLDGPSTTFPVYDNVWMGTVPGVPDSERFTSPSGPVSDTWAVASQPQAPATCIEQESSTDGFHRCTIG